MEIPAFFEGVATYLMPWDYSEMMGNDIFLQFHEMEISQYLQSAELEKLGGLNRTFQTTNQYSLKELNGYLNSISNELHQKPNVALDLSANGHSIGVLVVGPNQFKLMNTNELWQRGMVYNSESLAKILNNQFKNSHWLGWFIESNPLVMSTSIFTNANNPINLENLKASGKISE